jgi:Tfp pilus assembly protein PilN
VLALLFIVLLTALVAVWMEWQKKSAEDELVEIQDKNQQLLADQEQYAEVPIVLRELKARQDARASAMSTEMLWSPYLAAIASATPLEVSIDTISVTQDTVWTGSQNESVGPLTTPGTVGQVSINGRSTGIVNVSDWQDALSNLTGVVDVTVSSVAIADNDGVAYYAVGATLSLTPDAFANRFATEQ